MVVGNIIAARQPRFDQVVLLVAVMLGLAPLAGRLLNAKSTSGCCFSGDDNGTGRAPPRSGCTIIPELAKAADLDSSRMKRYIETKTKAKRPARIIDVKCHALQ